MTPAEAVATACLPIELSLIAAGRLKSASLALYAESKRGLPALNLMLRQIVDRRLGAAEAGTRAADKDGPNDAI